MKTEKELEEAIELYADMVRKICFIHMKQECDVDDVFQTVFFKYANASSFQTPEHEKAWLIRVTINACKDSLNTWFKRNALLQDDFDNLYSDNIVKDSPVLNAVMTLPSKYRDVIYLYYYEGYKINEIAKILNKKENTIHTWMKRAKEKLKDIIGGDNFE
ncbi:MAG: sigma-70 family RNA polymerase sigma factor [Coprobacillus sp.]